MKFSIIIPTRRREHLVTHELIPSLNAHTRFKEDVEILFMVDSNDGESERYVKDVIRDYPLLNIKYFKREQSMFMNRDYYNFLSTMAIGKYIWAVGDDCKFLVPRWDEIIEKKIEEYLADKPDRIMLAGIMDNTPKPKPTLPHFPCFPIVTRESIEAVGFFLHPNIPNWGTDYLIYLLYTQAGRYLEIHDQIYLSHISVHTRMVEKDETAIRVEKNFNALKMNKSMNIDLTAANVVPVQAQKLKEYIIKVNNEQMIK